MTFKETLSKTGFYLCYFYFVILIIATIYNDISITSIAFAVFIFCLGGLLLLRRKSGAILSKAVVSISAICALGVFSPFAMQELGLLFDSSAWLIVSALFLVVECCFLLMFYGIDKVFGDLEVVSKIE